MQECILELKNIYKTFPGVTALSDVHFQLNAGEIHALMGENGAGKSTFIKVITGVHRPDSGEMILNGKKVEFQSTRDSQKAGISCIYQHSTAYPDLSVTENIFLRHEITKGWAKTLDWKEMHEKTQTLLEHLGANFDSRVNMSSLSVAQQQLVEIAKALSANASIVIMDEPTAALTKKESEELYEYTEKLRAKGVSIILISHRFEDMYRLADRVTVLRDAQYVGTWDVKDVSKEEIIVTMVGREITQLFPQKVINLGDEVLRVEKLSRTGYFKEVSFSVKEGEIVALTGLVGAGRSEVAEAVFGIAPADEGAIFINGKEVKISSPIEAENVGIGLLPEDRQKQALFLDWEISKNIGLGNLKKFTKNFIYQAQKEDLEAKTLAEKLAVKASSIFDKVSSLSGGNQQKVVFAKTLTNDLKVIIMDEPTKGVDIGAKVAVYEIMDDLTRRGYGIILITSELPEALGMADRIIVMKAGRVTADMLASEATQESIIEASILGEVTKT